MVEAGEVTTTMHSAQVSFIISTEHITVPSLCKLHKIKIERGDTSLSLHFISEIAERISMKFGICDF
jgi:hypothetical protein